MPAKGENFRNLFPNKGPPAPLTDQSQRQPIANSITHEGALTHPFKTVSVMPQLIGAFFLVIYKIKGRIPLYNLGLHLDGKSMRK